jgi:hypothetical protein
MTEVWQMAQLIRGKIHNQFLLPRMTLAQRDVIVDPVPGLQIWCTDWTYRRYRGFQEPELELLQQQAKRNR